MDFDHVAFWVLKENLMPFLGKRIAIVRIGNALFVEDSQEGGKIIGAKGDVTLINRVDGLAIAEGNRKIPFCQMHLHYVVGRKADFTVEPLVAFGLGPREVLDRDVIETEHVGVKVMHAIDIARDKVDVVEFEFHAVRFPSLSDPAYVEI